MSPAQRSLIESALGRGASVNQIQAELRAAKLGARRQTVQEWVRQITGEAKNPTKLPGGAAGGRKPKASPVRKARTQFIVGVLASEGSLEGDFGALVNLVEVYQINAISDVLSGTEPAVLLNDWKDAIDDVDREDFEGSGAVFGVMSRYFGTSKTDVDAQAARVVGGATSNRDGGILWSHVVQRGALDWRAEVVGTAIGLAAAIKAFGRKGWDGSAQLVIDNALDYVTEGD